MVALAPPRVVLALVTALARVCPQARDAASPARGRRPRVVLFLDRDGTVMPVLRIVDARSRRDLGDRTSTCLGSRMWPSTSTGAGKSADVSRPDQRSSVTTSGRASPSGSRPGSTTTASPERRPDGTAITSPLRSSSSDFAVSIAARVGVLLGELLLPVPDPAAQRRVLGEVAQVARHRLGVPGERLLVPVDPARQPDHRTVGLELRERLLQDLARGRRTELVHEVDGHVVAGPERRAQRIRARGSEPTDRLGVDPRLPDDERVPLDVDAAPTGTARELRVLARREVDVRLAVVLHQLLEHDRPGGHVDAQRQRLGREHDLAQAADEQLLDRLLERGQQPGVVRRDAALQRLTPLPEPEHRQVGLGQVPGLRVDDPPDLGGLLRRVEPQPGPRGLRDRRVTARAAEHEHDRGQQAGRVHPLDHVRARRRLEPAVARRPPGARGRGCDRD